MRFGVFDQRLDRIQILFGQKLPVTFVPGDPGILRNRLAPAVFAGEQAALERKERQERDAQSLTLGEHAVLGRPLQQTVLVLHADESRRAGQAGRRRVRFAQLVDGKIRAADLSRFARLHELVQCAERFGDWYVGIRQMQLIEIDVVGAKTLETRIARKVHVFRLRTPPLTGHVLPELRRNDDTRPAITNIPAEQLFTAAIGVHVGGIEEVDADLDRRIHDLSGARLVDAAAEIVAAYADDGDVQSADFSFFHRAFLDGRRGFPELHARRLVVRPLSEKLDPLLFEVRIMLRGLHQIYEAF